MSSVTSSRAMHLHIVFLTLLAGIVACSAMQVIQIFQAPHDMIVCLEKPGDVLLHRQVVEKKYSLLNYVDATVQYPLDGVPRNETIHCIKALDQRTDGTGGYARIIDGGLEKKVVTVYMRSELSRGFKFIVEISGQ